MKCPRCQAKLLPVAGELFCLQCGEAVHEGGGSDGDVVVLEETSDPLLRRALTDATDGEMVFREAAPEPTVAAVAALTPEPLKAAAPRPQATKPSFASLRAMLAPPRPASTHGTIVLPSGPAAVASAAPVAEHDPVPVVAGSRSRGFGMAWAWIIGLAGLVLFVGVNVVISNYYSNRVYPGAKVGELAVGGWTFEQLDETLSRRLAKPTLAAMIDGRRYDLDSRLLGTPHFPELERKVKEAGRGGALPVVGVVQSWFSEPITPAYALRDEAVAGSVEKLEAEVNRQASNAAVVVVGANVLVLAEKPGVRLDRTAAAAAIRSAYGRTATAALEVESVAPEVTAAAYAQDVAAAQTMMGLNIQLTIRNVKYAPTVEQIAGWLVFAGPGKGVSVDAAGVAAWVKTIPGSFDRKGAVNTMVAALNGRQPAVFSPSRVRRTANPTPASTAAAWPVVSYTYCADEALAIGDGWTLGGRVQFTRVASGCNFALKQRETKAMQSLDPACAGQTTCRIHNDLAIATASWAQTPAGWAGDLAGYRAELVNHVVGQWLGFDHPSCSAAATQTPVLSAPAVVIPGCSPKWYAIPPELQDTKILTGF